MGEVADSQPKDAGDDKHVQSGDPPLSRQSLSDFMQHKMEWTSHSRSPGWACPLRSPEIEVRDRLGGNPVASGNPGQNVHSIADSGIA